MLFAPCSLLGALCSLLASSPSVFAGALAEVIEECAEHGVEFEDGFVQCFVVMRFDEGAVAACEEPVVDFEQGPAGGIDEGGEVGGGAAAIAFGEVGGHGHGCAVDLAAQVPFAPKLRCVGGFEHLHGECVAFLPDLHIAIGELAHRGEDSRRAQSREQRAGDAPVRACVAYGVNPLLFCSVLFALCSMYGFGSWAAGVVCAGGAGVQCAGGFDVSFGDGARS